MAVKLYLLSVRAKPGHFSDLPIDPSEKTQTNLSLDEADLGFLLDQINPIEVAEYYGMISIDMVDLHGSRALKILEDYREETDLDRRLDLLSTLNSELKKLMETI